MPRPRKERSITDQRRNLSAVLPPGRRECGVFRELREGMPEWCEMSKVKR